MHVESIADDGPLIVIFGSRYKRIGNFNIVVHGNIDNEKCLQIITILT